jgi:hypothetical protein
MPALEAYLELPWTIEIVLVAEAGSLAEAKLESGTSGDRAANSREPNHFARSMNWNRWMPSQPIATWMTPCNSRRVMLAGT